MNWRAPWNSIVKTKSRLQSMTVPWTPSKMVINFSVKSSRYITHRKKLKDPQTTLPALIERIRTLSPKQGPLLFQLAPKWKFSEKRLQTFISSLPKSYRYAFEFRDPSWFNDRSCNLMKENNIGFCIYELAGFSSPIEMTADFVYVRLHGPGEAYQGEYDTKTLTNWADALNAWSTQGKEIYFYFDNDQAGCAAQNAFQLQKMIANK
jgi:uncharacterized protein YecE (DUF72 family)